MKLFISIILLVSYSLAEGQAVPNLSNASVLAPNDQKASQLSAVPINIFTGVPSIGVPIYAYNNSNNGLSFNISLSYYAGGIRVGEQSNIAGFGWALSAGGVITRTVKGAPDDQPTIGYLYSAAIPTDFRSNGDKYYYDTLDAEQDIFQYSFDGRSGKFIIGKNGQVVVIPMAKIKILPTFGAGTDAQKIIAFRVITEDHVKYDFTKTVSATTKTKGADTSLFRSANSGRTYFSSWYLSQIISSFNTDTIKINYTQTYATSDFAYPQVTFVRNSDGVRTATYKPLGTLNSGEIKVSSVVFPGKTQVAFLYNTNGVSKIKITDSVFRFGYALDYNANHLLATVTPYTSKERKEPFSFSYYYPHMPGQGESGDTLQNKTDHWGYYNGVYNGTEQIPKINSYTWGANRNPSLSYAAASTLYSVKIPGGGITFYDYELNDHYPYTKDPHRITITPTVTSSNAILLSQVFKTKNQLVFKLDSTVSRSGSAPITGTGNLTVNIKSLDGLTTYATYTLSLYDLFYQGIKSYYFNVPNGSYLLNIPAITGTTITGSFPINVDWENRLPDNTHTAITAGGLRVRKVRRYGQVDNPAIFMQEYKYINADGTSSGFLGDIPKYDYPYQETVNYGGVTTTSYNVVSSEPLSNMDYSQGSPVGYSRVEVYEGTVSRNIGKTVYEFTSPQDVNANIFTAVFPYNQQELRDWGIGNPKKILVYDSLGNLVKKTVNNYAYDTSLYVNSNFKSIKLGHTFTYINGNPATPSTPRTRTFIAQDYYPTTGRAYITSTYDTIFHLNATQNNSYAEYAYDTNYNAIKVTSWYDRNRGLKLEKRLYYAYNYSLGGAIGKLRDSSILPAVISTENWITGDGNPRILSGTITDYQQIAAGYIKPLTVYALQSNAPVAQTTIGTFNPAVLNRNTNLFVAQNSFVAYDTKGNLLQTKSLPAQINSSVIMDYSQQYAVAQVSNAAISDIAYTSFESDGTGNWTTISSSVRDTAAITGKKGYNLTNGNITKTGLIAANSYLITVWAKTGASVSVNGTALSGSIASQLGWNLYTKLLSGTTSITVSGTGVIDELRLHPKDANMITTTYEPLIGPTSVTDANNGIMYNEYDNLNRLKIVRDKDRNILKKMEYSDVEPISVVPVWDTTTKVCVNGTDGTWTYSIKDINPYSDTYLTGTTYSGTDYCTCSTPALHPEYKVVNGICELATKCYTSSVYAKWNNVWQWKITWHWVWSDLSVSQDYFFYDDHSWGLLCPGGES